MASPLPHSLGRSGADLRSAGSVASFSTAVTIGGGTTYRESRGASSSRALRQLQSQDLEGLLDDSVPLDALFPEGGIASSSGVATMHPSRQVSLPMGPPGSDFRGFGGEAMTGRGPAGLVGLPSPVPFRGMSTPMVAAAGASPFSTPRQAASAVGGTMVPRSVSFHQPPPPTNVVTAARGGFPGASLSARPGQPPRGSSGGQPSGNTSGASAATPGLNRGSGGGSILDRAAYLSASRGSILANSLAGRQRGAGDRGGV